MLGIVYFYVSMYIGYCLFLYVHVYWLITYMILKSVLSVWEKVLFLRLSYE